MYVSAEMLVQKSLSDGYLVDREALWAPPLQQPWAAITEVNPLPLPITYARTQNAQKL